MGDAALDGLVLDGWPIKQRVSTDVFWVSR